MPRLRHKVGLTLALLLAVLVIVIISLPFWFSALLRPLLSRSGLTYESYRAKGSDQFVLHNVQFSTNGISFTARTVRALSPYAWLWHRLAGKSAIDFVQVQDWELRITNSAPARANSPRDHPAAADPQRASPASAMQQARRTLTQLRDWMPRAELSNGVVRLSSGPLLLPAVHWNQGLLSAEVEIPGVHQKASLAARLGAALPWDLTLASVTAPEFGLHLKMGQDSANVRLQGTARWMTNELALAAVFAQAGWVPQAASAHAASFRIPAGPLGLPGYQDMSGALQGSWTNGQFQIQIRAQAQPKAGQNLFPAAVLVRVHGDTNRVSLDEANVRTPWLRAEVSPGATVNFAGKLLSDEAKVEVTLDLQQQHWLPATGMVVGRAVLRAGLSPFPDATFTLSGTNLQSAEVRARAVDVAGTLSWPWLQISRADARFAEGGSAALALRADLATQSITNGVLHLEGNFGKLLVSTNASYKSLLCHVNFQGPINDLRHQGMIEVQAFTNGQLAPFDARLQWQGRQTDVDVFDGGVTTAAVGLLFRGSGKGDQVAPGLRFEQLTLVQTNRAIYTLAQPFTVSLDRDKRPPEATEWLLTLQPFQWRGQDRALSLAANLAWPLRGTFQAQAQNFDPSVFGGFLQHAPPALRVDQLNFAGAWSNGPAQFALDLAAHLSGAARVPVAVRVIAGGDGQGVFVRQFDMASGPEKVVVGHGTVPLWVEPTNPGHLLQFDQGKPLELSARTLPNTGFWNQVSEWTRLELADPQVKLELSGPLQQPSGTIEITVGAIDAGRLWTNRALPRLERLRADLNLDRSALRLNGLNFLLEGQSVAAQGRLPLGTNYATNWRRFFLWNEATGSVQVPKAQLAAFARFLPKTLSPQGTLDVNLALQPNFQAEGQVTIAGVATRPLPSLGPVNDLESRLGVHGRRIEVQAFTGTLGGEKFSVAGGVDLAARHPDTGLPRLELTLRGQNLPLARQPGFILRSDLDLTISSQTNGHALVSGSARLRDSVFLSDLRVLMPGKVTQPRQRPPYFSIDLDPVADWQLNLQVKGDRFLKVRSPFFQGQVSTNLKLEGTLREPIALGEVNVNSGLVQFPFANLRVTQGLVSLTSADPYRPQLFVRAGARALGYDVTMEVSGKADAPVILFNSTPPLSSEQVVLLITTGELPKQENSVSAQQRASRLAVFLGKNLLSEFSSGEGVADRLSIRSGENISEQGQQTYSVEYRINKDWSIVGEYDRFGAFNADVKWRLYSR